MYTGLNMSLKNEDYREGVHSPRELRVNWRTASVNGVRLSLRVEARLKVEYTPTAASTWSQGIDETGTKQKYPVCSHVTLYKVPSVAQKDPPWGRPPM